MIKLKEVRLYPTEFYLDAYFVNGNEKKDDNRNVLASFFQQRYGKSHEHHFNELDAIDWVSLMESEKDSEMKGEIRVIMVIQPKTNILVHELKHVFHVLADKVNLERGPESQEWQAYFQEYLFVELCKFEGDKIEYANS